MSEIYSRFNNGRRIQIGIGVLVILFLALAPVVPVFVFAEDEEEPVVEEQAGGGEEEGEDGAGGEGAEIDTGDAVAEGEVTNEVNTNTINTEGEEENGTTTPNQSDDGTGQAPEIIEDDEEGTGTTTPDVIEGEGEEELELDAGGDGDGDGGSVAATTTNSGDVGNTVTVNAETGENEAEGETAGATITTGDAIATARVVNVVNTTIFNSHGFFLFLMNLFGGSDLDLRSAFNFFTPPSQSLGSTNGGCGDGGCGSGGDASLSVTNEATTTNDVIVRSNTGGNSASGSDASVHTGNAYASADVINVANSNFVDSEYLLMTFNNFGNWDGDLVFPAADMFSQIFSGGSEECSYDSLDVDIDNEATVVNNVNAEADTGNNTAETEDGEAVVETGNAAASANVVNQVNTNIVCSDSFSILLNVHGGWGGNVFSAPDGVRWSQTPSGLQLYFSPDGDTSSAPSYGSFSFNADNDAAIENNIDVLALTGENEVAAGTGDAILSSGNAYASANVINVVNTNVIGRNWFLAIINIFGDWGGSVSFGRPDLWVGGNAQIQGDFARPGSEVTFQFTVANNGDADATDVVLEGFSDLPYLEFRNSSAPLSGSSRGSRGAWNIGTIPAGEYRTVSYTARISNDVPAGFTPILTTAHVDALENDENDVDNTEELSITVKKGAGHARTFGTSVRYGKGYGPGEVAGTAIEVFPALQVTKTAVVHDEVTASSTVDYEVTVENESELYAYGAVLVDELTNSASEVVSVQEWPLGMIYPNEEIVVTYSIEFGPELSSDFYTNGAQVFAYADEDETAPITSAPSRLRIKVTSIPGVGEELPLIRLNPPERVADAEEDDGDALALEEGSDFGDGATKYIAAPARTGIAVLETPATSGLAVAVLSMTENIFIEWMIAIAMLVLLILLGRMRVRGEL